MSLGVVGDWVYNALARWRGWSEIRDPAILNFIDGAEWISLWLVVTVTVISIFGLVAIYAERKVSAHMQSRLGPMRVGPKGLLQTLADGVKLLEKEDIIPKAADPVLFIAAPCFVFASAVAMFVVLPFFNYEGTKDIRLIDVSPSEVSFVAADDTKPIVGSELEIRREKARRKNAELIRAAQPEEPAEGDATEKTASYESIIETLRQSEAWRLAAHRGEYAAGMMGELPANTELRALATGAAALQQHGVRIDRALLTRGADDLEHGRDTPEARNFLSYNDLFRSAGGALIEFDKRDAASKLASGAIDVSEAYSIAFTAAYEKEHNAAKLKTKPLEPELAMAGVIYAQHLEPIKDVVIKGYHVDRPWLGTPAWNSTGIFFLLAISSVSVMGVVLAGWGSNNKWSLYGAIREAAQMVSYEIPMGIAALCVVVACQSLNLMDIAQAQEQGTIFGFGADWYGGIFSWNIIKFPVLFPVFIIWYIGVLAHTKRAPFDLPEAESELIAGFMTEYSGMRWSLFFLAEYGEMYALSALSAVLFLGGMASPFPFVDEYIKAAGPVAWMAWGAGMVIAKTLFLVFVMMWLRWTLPRIRLDQIMYMCLKVLLPFTMIALLLQTVWTLNPYVGAGGLVLALIVLKLYGRAPVAGAKAVLKPSLAS